MAKGSAMGLWRGKKGSTVFYALKNSNNGQRQAMRERVYEISNPKTVQQASQRLKMLPAQRVYSVLKPILRRSWQGVNYGGDGYREFMKYAMSMKSGYPYVNKDETRIVPGNYLLSKGVLPSVDIVSVPIDSDGDSFSCTLATRESGLSTIGQLSEVLVVPEEGVVTLNEGDQVTIIWVKSNQQTEPGGYYSWHYASFFVDHTDATPISDALPGIMSVGQENAAGRGYLKFNLDTGYCVAAAVIISRLNGSTYERSTSYMKCNENFLSWWQGAARIEESRVSYMGSAGAQSADWPVEPEQEAEITAPALYTISGLTGEKAECNGKKVWVRQNISNELTAVYAWPDDDSLDANGLIGENGRTIGYGENVTTLTPTDVTALANLPIIRTTTVPTA